MTRLPIILTDVPLTKESILEETKNDPELSEYYDYIKGGYFHMIPGWGGFYEVYYKNMHDVLPIYMTGIMISMDLNRGTTGVYKERALNVRKWLFLYMKKLLKRSSIWYVCTDIDNVPIDSSGMRIVEVDVNELIANYDKIDYPKIQDNIYYKIIDPDTNTK